MAIDCDPRRDARRMAIPAPHFDSAPRSAALRPVDLFAGMNGTERTRAIELEAQKRDGMIREWRFEAVTLKLAPDCRYTPDFYVLNNDGSVTFEETKGHWR